MEAANKLKILNGCNPENYSAPKVGFGDIRLYRRQLGIIRKRAWDIGVHGASRAHDNSCDQLLMRTETSNMKPNEPSRTALMIAPNELLITC
jgi:hypothetical protein